MPQVEIEGLGTYDIDAPDDQLADAVDEIATHAKAKPPASRTAAPRQEELASDFVGTGEGELPENTDLEKTVTPGEPVKPGVPLFVGKKLGEPVTTTSGTPQTFAEHVERLTGPEWQSTAKEAYGGAAATATKLAGATPEYQEKARQLYGSLGSPVVRGAGKAVASTVQGFAEPKMLGLMAASQVATPILALKYGPAIAQVVNRFVSGGFAADMLRSVPSAAEQLGTALESKNPEQIAEALAGLATTAGFVTSLGGHALGVGRAATTAGQKVAPAPAETAPPPRPEPQPVAEIAPGEKAAAYARAEASYKAQEAAKAQADALAEAKVFPPPGPPFPAKPPAELQGPPAQRLADVGQELRPNPLEDFETWWKEPAQEQIQAPASAGRPEPTPERPIEVARAGPTTPPQVPGGAEAEVPERRQNLSARELYERTPEVERPALVEKLHQEARTDDLTGLPNGRALAEMEADPAFGQRYPVVANGDIDDLKILNARHGLQVVDKKVIPAVGEFAREAMAKEEPDSVFVVKPHGRGDEFTVRGSDPAAVERVMKHIQQGLSELRLKWDNNGTPTEHGVGFSYGIGDTHEAADTALYANKSERKAAGSRLGEEARAALTGAEPGDRGVRPETPPEGEANAGQPPAAGGNLAAPGAQGEVVGEIKPKAAGPTGLSKLGLIPGKYLGGAAKVKTERGTEVQTRYAVVPEDMLTASHDTALNKNPNYPEGLQPRDRGRAASELQVSKIANALEPEFLGASPKASDGAPIVGPDGIVESGNGRVIGLRRAYEGTGAEEYKAWMAEHAKSFGLTADKVNALERPILVRVRRSDVDRVAFARQANETGTAAMSPTEMARTDAEKLNAGLLDLFDPGETGDLMTNANRPFMGKFLSDVVGPADQGRYVTEGGTVNRDLLGRVQNAILYSAYGDPDLVGMLVESPDVNIRNVAGGLTVAAPGFAKMRRGIESGSLHPLDISKDVTDAAKMLSSLRRQGMPVDVFLRQQTMFGEGLSENGKDLLKFFNDNIRSSKKIGDFLKAYSDIVEGAGDTRQGGMFAEAAPPTVAEALSAAKDIYAREHEAGGGTRSLGLEPEPETPPPGGRGPGPRRPPPPGGQGVPATEATGAAEGGEAVHAPEALVPPEAARGAEAAGDVEPKAKGPNVQWGNLDRLMETPPRDVGGGGTAGGGESVGAMGAASEADKKGLIERVREITSATDEMSGGRTRGPSLSEMSAKSVSAFHQMAAATEAARLARGKFEGDAMKIARESLRTDPETADARKDIATRLATQKVNEFVAMLDESNLRGMKESYYPKASKFAKTASIEDLKTDYYTDLRPRLVAAEEMPPFKQQRATPGATKTRIVTRLDKLLDKGSMEEFRDGLFKAFSAAAKNVGQILPPEEFDRLSNDPAMKDMLAVYKKTLEPSLRDVHRVNGGQELEKEDLGPLETYAPLAAELQKPSIAQRLAYRYGLRKPPNPGNYLRTGLASRYEGGLGPIGERYAKAHRANFRALGISEMENDGVLQRVEPLKEMPDSVNVGGVKYKAAVDDFGPPRTIIENGKAENLPPDRYVFPEHLTKEFERLGLIGKDIKARQSVALAVGKLGADIVNSGQIALGVDAFGHIWNGVQRLVVDGLVSGKPLEAAKTIVTSMFTKAGSADAPENAHWRDRIINEGSALPRWGTTTYSKIRAEQYGGRNVLENPWRALIEGFAPLIYGPDGFDIRSKIAAAKIQESVLGREPTKTELYDFLRGFGEYHNEFNSKLLRALKKSAISPFITAGMNFNKYAIKMGLNPLREVIPGSPDAMRARQIGSGLFVSLPAMVGLWYAAYHHESGEWPHQDNAPLFTMPKESNGDRFNLSSIFSFPGRAARGTGLTGLYEFAKTGSVDKALDRALIDITNTWTGPIAGPVVRTITRAAYGFEPRLSLNEKTGKVGPEPAYWGGKPSRKRNLLSAAARENTTIQRAIESYARNKGDIPKTLFETLRDTLRSGMYFHKPQRTPY